ncbi:MAG: class I SAM-dependent methyltransferase [Anaerolineales bacterium]|nr:class I SAM-dependent methyltransferase [Anaerolineales bacterium]
MIDPPVAQEAYNQLADDYAARIDSKAHNAFYDRPAVLSLLPDVTGKRVLDAGCGPGAYAEWLLDHGAQVVAVDANEKMLAHARERTGDRAEFHLANLNAPLDFLADASFDLVICPLVLDYIRDWTPLFREFHRLLRPGGVLVFSHGHPASEFFLYYADGNYHEVEQVSWEWTGFGTVVTMPSYRRPLAAVFNPLIDAGFVLDRVLEPRPIEAFREADREHYDQLMRQPGFLCIRAVKP